MGWGSGSDLMADIIVTIKKHVNDEDVRESIYKEIIDSFECHDWDTQEECVGEDNAYDNALKKLYPDWDWDE
jgi:hypothetical protein